MVAAELDLSSEFKDKKSFLLNKCDFGSVFFDVGIPIHITGKVRCKYQKILVG